MICYRDPCDEKLAISSGILVLHDPATRTGLEVANGSPRVAEIAYLLTDSEMAGLEVTLQSKLSCTHYSNVGVVGVDSAKIVLGDKISIESCPNNVLFLFTRESNLGVTRKIVSRFKLNTRRIIDETAEILTDDPFEMYSLISKYLTSQLSLNPDDYLIYYSEDGYWQRCSEAAWDGGFFYAGKDRLFLLNTGSDGSFAVVVGYCDDLIVKIWLLLTDGLFVDGKIEYNLRPLDTRPPRKDVSEAFFAMLERVARARGEKPFWKLW